MIGLPFEQIDRKALEALVAAGVAERRDLEFKRDLPGELPKDSHEFLADVTSLANAQGGDLIFGIEEDDGVAKALAGVVPRNADEALQRLESLIRDSVDPRLTGVRMEWIPLDAPRGAIVMRIPASLAAPHRVASNKSGLFYSRNSRGKYPMDAHELRMAFTQADQLPQKIRQLHEAAVKGAQGHDMPVALHDQPAAVTSIIPLGFFREVRDLPLTYQTTQLPTEAGSALDWMTILEGVMWHTPPDDHGKVRSFALSHWTGRVDVAWTIGSRRDAQGKAQRRVFPNAFEKGLMDAAGSAIGRLKEHGVEGPWVLLTTLIGVRDHIMVVGDGYATKAAYKDTAALAPLIIDQANETTLMPQLKAFWLLFGQARPKGWKIG